MATEYTKPLPRPLSPALTRPFLGGGQTPRIADAPVHHVRSCLLLSRSECPRCLSAHLEWVKVSGRARLHSFTIVQQPANPAFRDDVPYVYAVVQLDEGPRLVSNIVQCGRSLRVDMPLKQSLMT